MNIVSSTSLRNNFASILAKVDRDDYLLVSKRGKIASAIVNIDLFEDLVALSNKKYVESVRKARKEYEKGDFFSHKQVFGEV